MAYLRILTCWFLVHYYFLITGLWKRWQIMATLKESLVTVLSRMHIEDGEDQASYNCKPTAKTLNKQSLADEKGGDTRDWGMNSKNCRSEKAKY